VKRDLNLYKDSVKGLTPFFSLALHLPHHRDVMKSIKQANWRHNYLYSSKAVFNFVDGQQTYLVVVAGIYN